VLLLVIAWLQLLAACVFDLICFCGGEGECKKERKKVNVTMSNREDKS